MEVRSDVPAEEFDLANERPFEFTVDGHYFKIKPLSLNDYYSIEKKLNLVLAALYYYGVDLKKDLATFLKIDSEHLENIKNVENIQTIVCRLVPPIPLWKWVRMVIRYNWQHRRRLKKWIFKFSDWMERKLSLNQSLDLASWFMRYCSEYKKKIFQILQQGIDSATKFQKAQSQDLSDFIDEDWKQGYRSVGQTMFGLPGP